MLLHRLRLHDVEPATLKARLQSVPADRMLFAYHLDDTFQYLGALEYGFVPTVDDAFVPVAPHRLPDAHRPLNARPLLIGYTHVETATQFPIGFAWRDVRWPDDVGADWQPDAVSDRLQSELLVPDDDADDGNSTETAEQHGRRLLFLETLRGIVDMKYGIWSYANGYRRRACRPIVYQFGYAGQLGAFRWRVSTAAGGPVHGDELGYLFGALRERREQQVEWPAAAAMRERMVEMWANFIRSG